MYNSDGIECQCVRVIDSVETRASLERRCSVNDRFPADGLSLTLISAVILQYE